MTPNPILKVLSILKKYRVKCLLIGGQACIIYGAAEFSRDSDFVVLSSADNLECLKKALSALKTERIYVPPLEISYLEKGHACHFRCQAKSLKGLRIDVISKLRGCEPFDKLWQRRKKVFLKGAGSINIISLEDLAQSKKTQRDKDWLMLKRLVNNDIILKKYKADDDKVKWWFKECRDPIILNELAQMYPRLADECSKVRPLISFALAKDLARLESSLSQEEALERKHDTEYWQPLRKELELLRRQ